MENLVLDTIKERHSCKKYKSDSVPEEMIEKIVDAGLRAANGQGKQASIVIAVTNKEVRDKLSKLNAEVMGASIDPFYNAPVVLVVLANKAVGTYVYDGSLTMGNMLLAAESLGLGACWIHRAKQVFETKEGKQILKDLGIEGDYEGIGNCIIGYKDGEPKLHELNKNRAYYIK